MLLRAIEYGISQAAPIGSRRGPSLFSKVIHLAVFSVRGRPLCQPKVFSRIALFARGIDSGFINKHVRTF